jgi:hypothetical protein
MKRNFLGAMLCLLLSNFVFAQWTTSGTNIYNNNTGKVGIGNTAPTTLVDIGNATKSVAATSNVPTANITGMQVRTDNPANVSYQNYFGNMFFTSQSGTATYGSLTGISNWVTNSNSSNVYTSYNSLRGIQSTVEVVNGYLNFAYGIRSIFATGASSGIKTAYGLYTSGAGSNIENSYGLYIESVGGTSKSYGVYVSDAAASNYFAGNVGIGTLNNGSFKLAVEGKIGAREVQVTATNPFPDYVFEKNYSLMNLDNLDQYIQVNKHLPNIPSAKEVEEAGGIELGKMNVKLVEKVEELTLYIIDLNKRLKQIEEENELLKSNKIK